MPLLAYDHICLSSSKCVVTAGHKSMLPQACTQQPSRGSMPQAMCPRVYLDLPEKRVHGVTSSQLGSKLSAYRCSSDKWVHDLLRCKYVGEASPT